MSKNVMADVVELLGLEPLEEFKLRQMDNIYRFNEGGKLQFFVGKSYYNEWETADLSTLRDILQGSFEIIKLPFKPKLKENYWSYFTAIDGSVCIANAFWSGCVTEKIRLKFGFVYKTEEEAEEHKAEFIEWLESDNAK